jgi:hypothetical protein
MVVSSSFLRAPEADAIAHDRSVTLRHQLTYRGRTWPEFEIPQTH